MDNMTFAVYLPLNLGISLSHFVLQGITLRYTEHALTTDAE